MAQVLGARHILLAAALALIKTTVENKGAAGRGKCNTDKALQAWPDPLPSWHIPALKGNKGEFTAKDRAAFELTSHVQRALAPETCLLSGPALIPRGLRRARLARALAAAKMRREGGEKGSFLGSGGKKRKPNDQGNRFVF